MATLFPFFTLIGDSAPLPYIVMGFLPLCQTICLFYVDFMQQQKTCWLSLVADNFA